jgi:hypothetical protein
MAQEHRVAEDATVIVTTPNFSVNRSARTASLFGDQSNSPGRTFGGTLYISGMATTSRTGTGHRRLFPRGRRHGPFTPSAWARGQWCSAATF